LGERGGEGEAVIETTGRLARTTESAQENEAAKGILGEARQAASTGPETVGLIEFVGADRERIVAGRTAVFEEGREAVLLILVEGTGSRDGFGRLEALNGPEPVAQHRPGENGREDIAQLLRKLRGLAPGQRERDGKEREASTKVRESRRE